MEHCLLRGKDGEFYLSRLDSYKRYINTIKPMDELLNYLGWDIPILTLKYFK